MKSVPTYFCILLRNSAPLSHQFHTYSNCEQSTVRSLFNKAILTTTNYPNSGQFNEAILHTLFVAKEFRYNHNLSYILSQQGEVGVLYDYAKMLFGDRRHQERGYFQFCDQLRLQALLATEQSPDGVHQTFLGRIGEATCALEEILNDDDPRSHSLRSELENYRIFSSNPIFGCPALSLVCAAATDLKLKSGLSSMTRTQPTPDIRDESSLFWLIQAACYLGSQYILDRLPRSFFVAKNSITEAEIELTTSKCVAVAIERGHQQMAKEMLQSQYATLANLDFYVCPYTAAMRACDVEIARHLLSLDLTPLFQQNIIMALSDPCTQPSSIENYCEVFELFWPFTERLQSLRQSAVTDNVARIGSVQIIRYLASHRGLSAVRSQYGPNRGALQAAARNGHIKCIRELLENRYFENISSSGIKFAVQNAAQIALSSNHLPIFQELHHRFNVVRHSSWFSDLAGADGAIPLMKERLDQDPGLLSNDLGSKTRYDPGIAAVVPTVGQSALENALSKLRCGNVEFLLSLGIRLSQSTKIKWSDYVKRKEDFEATQQVLHQYSAEPLIIVV